MDGVSFSPVSSSSLQRKAGNQICRYRNPLACYGNKASHMCFCARVSLYVCVCVCLLQFRVLGKGEQCEKEMRVYLSMGYTFTSSNCRAKYTDPLERSHADRKNSTFHPVNISTTLIMFTYTEISPLNTIFHPGFGSAH